MDNLDSPLDVPDDEGLRALRDVGKIWRLRDKLADRVATKPFNVSDYENYGRVLLAMGDTPRAGKYLFLCGVRRPEYEQAIGTFLSFVDRGQTFIAKRHYYPRQNLKLQVPLPMRHVWFADLPVAVQAALNERKSTLFWGEPWHPPSPSRRPYRLGEMVEIAVLIALLLLAVLCFVVGALTVLNFLLSWRTGH
jgi:hypothetical protein